MSLTMNRKITSTHSCLCFMLFFAQCFGMLPISGITKEDCSYLKFKWVSKRTIYSIVFAVTAAFNMIFQILKMVRYGKLEFDQCVTLIFFSVTFLTVLVFIDVARKWPELMKKWTEVEITMRGYGFPFGLHRKLQIITVVIMTAAVAEHSLFIAVQYKSSTKGHYFIETVNLYFEGRFDYIFCVIPYNIGLGIIVQILNTFSTISWNFMDVFVILISLSLSSRFSQVVKNISFLTEKRETNENVWRKVREDYTRLTVLCLEVDEVVSNTILISCGNNICVIIVQLFYSVVSPFDDGTIDKIYYVYSFTFLIIRTVTVALYAATINSESKKPGFYLGMLPHQLCNIEVDRILYQIKYDAAALTGRKLFRVTNSFILRVTGAIVSYELVLVHFNHLATMKLPDD